MWFSIIHDDLCYNFNAKFSALISKASQYYRWHAHLRTRIYISRRVACHLVEKGREYQNLSSLTNIVLTELYIDC